MRRAQRLGRIAAVTQLVLAGVLAGFVSLHAEMSAIPRGAILLGIFALPAVVGWIGANHGRPALVAAAAVTSGMGAFIAFSGVTLIFLMPAVLFLASSLLLGVPTPGEPRGGVASGAAQLVLAAAICALVVGAGASALLITDSACWRVHQTPAGSYVERLPYSNDGMTLAGDITSGGCSTGLISVRGAGLGAVLAAAALWLVSIAVRRRTTGPPASSAPAPAG